MPRNIESERGIFSGQQLFLGPLLRFRQRTFTPRIRLSPGAARAAEEQPALPDGFLLRFFLPARNRLIDGREKRAARSSQAVQRPRLHQTLQHAFIQASRLNRFAESEDALKSSARFARLANGLGRVLAHVLDRGQPKPNIVAHRCEVKPALVHVRRQHADSHSARFVDVLHHLLRVPRIRTQHRSHELHRKVDLQIRRLIRQQCIGARMRLGEPVQREFFHQPE